MWDKELNEMTSEAFKDKSKKGKELVRLLTSIDDTLSKKIIKVYIERCKFRYVLAFLQWRNLSYHSNPDDLLAIFCARVDLLLRNIRQGKSGKFKK